MSQLKKRIGLLEKAEKGINPAEVENHSEINDYLASLRDEGLIRFEPKNIVNSNMQIKITSDGLKRLDEMQRSTYPLWLVAGIPTAVIALAALLYKIFSGE